MEVPYFIGLEVYDIIVTLSAVLLTVIFPLTAIIVLNKRVYTMVRHRGRKTSALSTLIHNSLPTTHIVANVVLPPSPATPIINIPGVPSQPMHHDIGPQVGINQLQQLV